MRKSAGIDNNKINVILSGGVYFIDELMLAIALKMFQLMVQGAGLLQGQVNDLLQRLSAIDCRFA